MLRPILLAVLWLALPLRAEELTIVWADYPPFAKGVRPDGKTQVKEGMLVDFLKAFSRQHPQYTFNNICVPRKRMDAMMLNGEAQAFFLNNPMFVRAHRQEFIWSDPIWHTEDKVVTLAGKAFRFERPEDLFGKTIGKIFGNGYGEYDRFFEEGRIKAEDAKSPEALFKMALAGRVDAFIANTHTAPYEMRRAGLDPSRFTFSRKPVLAFDLSMQINRHCPDFRDQLNRFIAQSRRNGFLQRLEDRFLK
jgi:ABC-type amino acid transport substrate-binding protein